MQEPDLSDRLISDTPDPASTPDSSEGGRRGRRSGGRAGNTRRSGSGGARFDQAAWRVPENPDAPTEPLTAEGVQAVHNGAMRILEDIGIDFLNDDALKILHKAGCTVDFDTKTVRMGRDFVMEMVGHAPETFAMTPRNPTREVTVGGKHMLFLNVGSPPNYSNLDEGRHPGNHRAYQDLVKLTQTFNCIHLASGYPVEPVDIHASIRHLDCIFDKLTLTDKVVHIYSLGSERVEDGLEMVRIASGLSQDEFDARPRMYTNINSSSPLKHDWPMLDGAMRLARRGQPVMITPFTLAGAMAPVTMIGAVTQSVAEGLAAVALLQYINPGTPVVYGSFTSNVDMKSGAPAFGTPEFIRATQMSGQMARFYGLPFRSSNATAANSPDPQATWETAFSMWANITSRANVIYHAAGWLEGGLCASYEKFVMDCEMLQQMIYYMQPVTVNDDEIAVEAIREVGPHGHFFGTPHTQERYETAFYAPFMSDWRNFEAWTEGGAPTALDHAHRIWKQILADYQPPPMDGAIREELETFVARRKEEGGAPTDF
ncbi:MAG: trimethylamine methyltransferase family protein [Pseudomonadota bacterium]